MTTTHRTKDRWTRYAAEQDSHPPQGLRPPAARQVREPDRGDGPAHRRDDHRPRAPAHGEERLLRDPEPLQGQGLARALRGAHAQAPDRHPLPDAEDGRLADAARPPGRRRYRDQAMRFAAQISSPLAN